MRDLVLILLVSGSLPFILARPYIGVLAWHWLGLMNPQRLTWGFAYDFPFSMYVGAALLISLVFSRLPKRLPWSPLLVVWILFFIWTYVTTWFSLAPHVVDEEWSRWWKIQLMTLVTIMVIKGRDQIQGLIWVVVVSLGFYGVKGGLFSLTTGGLYRVYGPDKSFIGDNTSLALALIMIVPLMWYLLNECKIRWMKWALIGAIGLTCLAILGSYSRGAVLGIVAMISFFVIKSRKKIFLGIVILTLAPLLLSYMPDSWFQRMQTIESYEEDSSAMGRINAWWFAFNLAKDRPLVGGGFRTFTPSNFEKYAPVPENFHDAHSNYFEVLGEHGFIGLGLYLLLGILAYRTGSLVIKNSKGRKNLRWSGNLAAMVQVSLVGYAVAGAFLGLAYFDLYYLLIAIVLLLSVEVKKELNKEVREIQEPHSIHKLAVRGRSGDS